MRNKVLQNAGSTAFRGVDKADDALGEALTALFEVEDDRVHTRRVRDAFKVARVAVGKARAEVGKAKKALDGLAADLKDD